MAKRGGPARGLLLKNVGRAHIFNSLTRISPPRITRGPRGAAAGRGKLAHKKKKLTLAAVE